MLPGLMFLLAFPSCTIEKKLGKEFLAQAPQFSIELFPPQYLFKFNHKGEMIPGFDSLPATVQDSLLYENSRFIKFVDDSTFLEKYVNSFIDELRSIGFRVFVGNVDSIMQTEPQAYVLNMSQVQLDEYFDPYEDSQQMGDTIYYKTFDLNAVDASTWFDLNKFNAVKPVKTVLYSSFTASDGFSGNFTLNNFTNSLRYHYKIDSLRLNDVYELSSYTGRRDASYFFDYFMNQYIAYHMPEGLESLGYLHYSPSTKKFEFTDEEKFEVLNNK